MKFCFEKKIDFSNFIGSLHNNPGFISTSIGMTTNSKNIKNGELSIEMNMWVHKGLETPSPKKTRNQISKEVIDKLYETIVIKESSKFLQISLDNIIMKIKTNLERQC